MSKFKPIRKLLGVTQQVLADGIGCTQGNICHYERGQTLPPSAAKNLIAFAAGLGVELTYDQIYGGEPLPKRDALLLTADCAMQETSHV